MINLPVLVLNQSYEPLNICRVRRAVVLIYQNKAEMLENGQGLIHSADRGFPVPSVIRLATLAKHPHRLERKLTRQEIFRRDHYTCQYCGKETRQLTIDHVIPRYRGGEHSWENVASACVPCNRRKAGLMPKEANMHLLSRPHRPRGDGIFHITVYRSEIRREWQKFLPQSR
ncbi:HNH endonuclease [Chloroflexota bacterium]